MHIKEDKQANNKRQDTKAKLSYAVYRPFFVKRGVVAFPGDTVLCTKVEAMCINTMQSMTLRKIKRQKDEST
jgi:hypothetical protein